MEQTWYINTANTRTFDLSSYLGFYNFIQILRFMLQTSVTTLIKSVSNSAMLSMVTL